MKKIICLLADEMLHFYLTTFKFYFEKFDIWNQTSHVIISFLKEIWLHSYNNPFFKGFTHISTNIYFLVLEALLFIVYEMAHNQAISLSVRT